MYYVWTPTNAPPICHAGCQLLLLGHRLGRTRSWQLSVASFVGPKIGPLVGTYSLHVVFRNRGCLAMLEIPLLLSESVVDRAQ
jgi:hypothetical protein